MYLHSQSWLLEPTVSATGVPGGGIKVSRQTESRLLGGLVPVESFSALQARLQTSKGPIEEQLVPGLERRLSGTPDQMMLEWSIPPGVDPGQIELEFPGIDEVEPRGDRELVLHQQPETTLHITGVKAWQGVSAQTIEIPVTVTYQGNGRVRMNFGVFVTSDPLRVSLQVVTRQGFASNATLTVTSGGDSGAGTLRDQIAAAAAGDTIVFSGVTTVTLTTAELLINKNLTIDGGAGVTVTRSTVGGTPNFRIFNVGSGTTVIFNNLSITNGIAVNGGGINSSGNLTILNSTISGNTVTGANINQGGGIWSASPLTLTNCTISGNLATGTENNQ
ncbi:MAG TPA: right-handed parallel beta-helix repeat-containing protein, partial [Acidobacteriota bacterium]|nr:right-handed parallel beta-helix repeat-containing protein [Acidobacteriota bacterium]